MSNIDKKIEFIDSLQKDAQKMTRSDIQLLNSGNIIYSYKSGTDARNLALEREDYTCICCGYRPNNINKLIRTYDEEEGRKLHTHRIVFGIFGGDYVISNVVILCKECHIEKLRGYFKYKRLYDELEKITDWNILIDKSFEFFKMFIKEFGKITDNKTVIETVKISEYKKENNKVDIFKHLFDKHGVEKVLADVIVVVDKQSGGFYMFKEGKQGIIIVEPPRADIDEKYKYSDGVGFTAIVSEINSNGHILGITHPITFTTNQFWELVGQVKANFSEWSPLIDQSFEIIRNLKFEANTASYEVNGEERSKTRFTLIKEENFTSKTLWVKEKANESRAKEGTVKESVGGQTGVENKDLGFRSDLNARYGKEFDARVENVKKFTREDFTNPDIGETKWFRVLEHPKLVPEITTHDAFVVKVDEILHAGYDQEGNPQYKVLRPNVNYWLGQNTAAQLVGNTEKRLSPTGKKPDKDYGCIINSTWSVEGAENPKAAAKGYTSDKMYILSLLELDQKIVNAIIGEEEEKEILNSKKDLMDF